MPLLVRERDDDDRRMFYAPTSRWQRLKQSGAVRLLTEITAGLHAGNGLAHGVRPPADSPTRMR